MLNNDYTDMLHVLLDNSVKFMLVGVAPRRIDIITTISGVSFVEACDRSQIVEIEGLRIPVLSLDDLIRNKRATGQDKDRLDADRLENARS